MSRQQKSHYPKIGIDAGTFAVKGVLYKDGELRKTHVTKVAGHPVAAVRMCFEEILREVVKDTVLLALCGANSDIAGEALGIDPVMDIEALQKGLELQGITEKKILSLGHESMYYMEIGADGGVEFFNRNGQCAAGSGAFWYQQAARLGFDDRELAETALAATDTVKISGRCAVFAKSDMTHAINEGATLGAVASGMADALSELVVTGVAQNRLADCREGDTVVAVGGVAENKAVARSLMKRLEGSGIHVHIPKNHEYLSAIGAIGSGKPIVAKEGLQRLKKAENIAYKPAGALPPLPADRVTYLDEKSESGESDLSVVYLGVDCGSVSTKCVLIDAKGAKIGGIYLPTEGRPALQVIDLIQKVRDRFGDKLQGSPIIACTTGSGRFLSQKILGAEYAVDEITCQAEGVKWGLGERSQGVLSIIEIGGEDAKFLQLKNGVLHDYNMNPVCAAGTGTFLENLANLLGVSIKDEFSASAFQAEYAIDLGDRCTLLSQSALSKIASQGLPLPSQLASLAYSSAKNYLSRTAENRPMTGTVVFTGATGYNHALVSAFAGELDADIVVPPHPELSGALGAARTAMLLYERNESTDFTFKGLEAMRDHRVTKRKCGAKCEHDHNCTLDSISFSDGSRFLYGDRCGRFSELHRRSKGDSLPDYLSRRKEIFYSAAGEPAETGPTVGIARAGLFFEMYPFWAAFFRRLGARVVLSSETTEKTLESGKTALDSEMCYPIKVLMGQYAELAETDPDFIFIPEVINLPPLPWAEDWPRSFTCSLLQTIKGTVVNSLSLEDHRVLYAQLNYKQGPAWITGQLRDVAARVLGDGFSEELLRDAVAAGYRGIEEFESRMEREGEDALSDLFRHGDKVTAVFLGRSYTIYDDAVSKQSLQYARQQGILAIPQELIIAFLKGWQAGRIDAPYLPAPEEYAEEIRRVIETMDNIYPIQLQKMLSAAVFVRFYNIRKSPDSGLPFLRIIFQDPFKCGPNAMLRHFLNNLTESLRLTLDEHTAPAGMITRLEAFRNTCLSRDDYVAREPLTARTSTVLDLDGKTVLIPEPSDHAKVFRGLFRRHGVNAELLPRSADRDHVLARRQVNGNECLPLIQNMQDFLEYCETADPTTRDDIAFFQGWACGPCRYGLYSSTQSLLINKAGFGAEKICAVKLGDAYQKFGWKFVISSYDGMVAMDVLYKLLHFTRPYEKVEGASDEVFTRYSNELSSLLEIHDYSVAQVLAGTHVKAFEKLIRRAAAEFEAVPRNNEKRPRIIVAGEFYVRLDDRCNQDIVRAIEAEGGEVSLSPASELFAYTQFINHHEAVQAFRHNRDLRHAVGRYGNGFLSWLAGRDARRLENAGGALIAGHHEPEPVELRRRAVKYVSEHYGGEPPMTMGRIRALAATDNVSGAITVAPFSCMPGSLVEAQLSSLREDTGIPIVAVYYDGRENPNREEFVKGLVYQAKQKMTGMTASRR